MSWLVWARRQIGRFNSMWPFNSRPARRCWLRFLAFSFVPKGSHQKYNYIDKSRLKSHLTLFPRNGSIFTVLRSHDPDTRLCQTSRDREWPANESSKRNEPYFEVFLTILFWLLFMSVCVCSLCSTLSFKVWSVPQHLLAIVNRTISICVRIIYKGYFFFFTFWEVQIQSNVCLLPWPRFWWYCSLLRFIRWMGRPNLCTTGAWCTNSGKTPTLLFCKVE